MQLDLPPKNGKSAATIERRPEAKIDFRTKGLLESLAMTSTSGSAALGNRQSRRSDRRLCGAKTRAGGACQVRAEPGRARCRFHGGKSTGPKTEAGRNRISEAQRRRWQAFRERHQTNAAADRTVQGANGEQVGAANSDRPSPFVTS